MNKMKLIAVDLDGTLFGNNHEISPRTSSVLHEVASHGHGIVVVTGRSAHSAIPRLGSLPTNSRVVCANGAYEVDRSSGKILWSQPLLADSVIALRRRILNQLPDTSFGWETLNGLGFEDQFIEQAGGAHTLEQGGVRERLGECDVLKLYVRSRKWIRGDLQRQLVTVLGGEAEVSTSGAPFVELTAQGVDKASGLARVAKSMDLVASDTIAFGDNLNDLPMLNWAGESVAMGNAMDEVKAIATSVTSSNIDHGVAEMLEKKILRGEL